MTHFPIHQETKKEADEDKNDTEDNAILDGQESMNLDNISTEDNIIIEE